tara:strand:- start:25875 stop:29177 length:3303 start_codon:yes stop_codon:yes gene_type:complete
LVLAGIAFVALFWRLSTGPISLDYVTPYIEKALSTTPELVEVKIQNTELVWAGWGKAFDIRIYNAAILGRGGKILAMLPEASVGLSVPALFRGIVAPTHMEINGLSASVERAEDGHIALGFFAGKDDVVGQEIANNISSYVAKLSKPNDLNSVFGYLDVIRILDVNLRYSDAQTGANWHAPETNIELIREADGIEAIASMGLKFGDRSSHVRAHAIYSPDRPGIDISVDLDDIYPSDLAARLPRLSYLKPISVPVSGQVRLSAQHTGEIDSVAFNLKGAHGSFAGNIIVNAEKEYDLSINLSGVRLGEFVGLLPTQTTKFFFDAAVDARISGQITSAGKIRNIGMQFNSGAGLLRYPGVFESSLQFDSIQFSVNADNDFSSVVISDINARFGEIELNFDVWAHRMGNEIHTRINGLGTNIQIESLAHFWPVPLGAEAREWVTNNIKKGKVDRVSVKLVAQTPIQKIDSFRVQSLSGGINFRNLEVGYFKGFPKVQNVGGTATFTKDRFDLDVARGSLLDLKIDNGVVRLSQLDSDEEQISIDLVARGPLATALSLANRKPLGFVGGMGINPAAVGGEMAARLGFRFPLRTDVKLKEVNIVGAANLDNVSMKPGPFGFELSNSDLELKISNDVLRVGGQAEVNGVPIVVDWHEMIASGEGIRSRYILNGELEALDLRKLGLPYIPLFRGHTGMNLIVTRFGDGRTEVLGSSNLRNTVLSIPKIGWIKPAGQSGMFRFGLTSFADGRLWIERFDLLAGNMEAAGKLSFEGGDNRTWSAVFSKFKVGNTDIRGRLSRSADGKLFVRLEGEGIDIEPFLFGGEVEDREIARKVFGENKQLFIDMNVDRLRTGPDAGVGRTEGQIRFIGEEIDMLSLTANLVGKKLLRINFAPKESGHALDINSNDAGAALRMLGWTNKLEGGKLSVNGQRHSLDEPLHGVFKLSNYKLTQAPALARLLQVASLTGIFDALQSGLDFVSFDGTFLYANKYFQIERSRAYGSSIGITVEGALDLEEDIAELKGTIVPAYTVNRVLGKIPILGPILIGGEDEGMFAATYAVNGSLEDPAIAVNPLSALAPGFLRNLFNAIGSEAGNVTQRAPGKIEK